MRLPAHHVPPVDLRVQFGDRLRLGWEAGGTTRSAWPVEERLWLLEVRCKYGVIYPYGGGVLAAFTDRPRVGARLRRLPFILSARGDLEVVVTFHVGDVKEVLVILQPYRRRRLSEAQRAKNAETLAKARQLRREALTQHDFTALGSTRESKHSSEGQRPPKVRLADAEVLLSQHRKHR